eukprot:Colp12_sorted_trinity150504_noHs@4802
MLRACCPWRHDVKSILAVRPLVCVDASFLRRAHKGIHNIKLGGLGSMRAHHVVPQVHCHLGVAEWRGVEAVDVAEELHRQGRQLRITEGWLRYYSEVPVLALVVVCNLPETGIVLLGHVCNRTSVRITPLTRRRKPAFALKEGHGMEVAAVVSLLRDVVDTGDVEELDKVHKHTRHADPHLLHGSTHVSLPAISTGVKLFNTFTCTHIIRSDENGHQFPVFFKVDCGICLDLLNYVVYLLIQIVCTSKRERSIKPILLWAILEHRAVVTSFDKMISNAEPFHIGVVALNEVRDGVVVPVTTDRP